MDRYRSLYKENASMLTPGQHNRTNRALQNANRAKSRRQIFESGRNIDISPTPRKVPNTQKDLVRQEIAAKENTEVVGEVLEIGEAAPKLLESDANKSRIELVASKANDKKATRQEAFLLKFIEWKETQKLKEQKKNEKKRRPFVSSGGVGGSTFGNIKNHDIGTFVPKGHTKFNPPAVLQNPSSKMTSAARDLCANGRKSFYTVVPTPPSKKPDSKKSTATTKTPCQSNLARTNTNKTPAVGAIRPKLATAITLPNTKNVVKTGTIPKSCTKPTAVVEPSKNTLGRVLTYPSTLMNNKAAGVAQNIDAKVDNNVVTSEATNNNNCIMKKSVTVANRPVKRLIGAQKSAPEKTAATTQTRKPIWQKKNIGSTETAKAQKPTTSSGAGGKAHLLQNKRAVAAAASANINQPRNAKFATSFKAKKIQTSTFHRPNAPSKITIKGKTLLDAGQKICKTDAAFAIAETPTDLLNINPYQPFVTSTRVKSLSPHTTNAPNISPINKELDGIVASINRATQKNQQNIRTLHGATSAKRVLLTHEVKPSMQDKPTLLQRQTSKFNFIRYSVGLSELDTSGETEKNSVGIDEEQKREVDGFRSAEQVTVLEVKSKASKDNLAMPFKSAKQCESASDKTPISKESERPVNYVGSFVSVSRGKGSARKERERRDSIYVPSVDTTFIPTASVTPIKVSKEETGCQSTIATPLSIEARRMLEAVRYFRQQLNSEIERLHALCDQWDVYKSQNLNLLQQTGGEDMINVTVGQAKLLTSKKFHQFRGLIDRCENGARGTAAASDGSEDTKLVTDVDLEGFWSMLNLQVDNVEKRFENLTLWKSNNWSDPEDMLQSNKQTKPKAKPNLTKVKKAKAPAKTAKASSGLQAMLRKMHAEMRKNKENVIPPGSNGMDVALISEPTKQRQRRSHSGTPKIECTTETQRNSTPRRVSVVVRDRKSLSAAATVISLPADSAMASAVAAQRRISRLTAANGESPKSLKFCSNNLRRSLSNMEKTLSNCNDLLRTTLSGNANKARRRSGTPNFIESSLDTEGKRHLLQQQMSTPPPAPVSSRKSILKTPGTAKGKPKNVIFNDKLRVKKFKFTIEDDDKLSDEEELRMQTSSEELLNDQRIYSLRTRKVLLRPSSEFEIPKA